MRIRGPFKSYSDLKDWFIFKNKSGLDKVKENEKFKEINDKFNKLEEFEIEDRKDTFYSEESIDWIAYYCPKKFHKDKWGVYFVVKNFNSLFRKYKMLIENKNDVLLRFPFDIILFHELFHHFTEEKFRSIGEVDRYLLCDPWCNFEEALANNISYYKIVNNINVPEIKKFFEDELFERDKLPGYGDWDKVNYIKNTETFIEMKQQEKCDINMNGNIIEKELSNKTKELLNRIYSSEYYEKEIPYYLDFGNETM